VVVTGAPDEEFAAFCRREHPRLVGALDLLTGSRALAEEFAQEALARAYRSWGHVRGLDAPGAYVHRTAVNLATSAFRRRAAERRAHTRMGVEREGSDEPDAAVGLAVREALGTLRVEQRRVLVLRYFLGYSVEETATTLNMPIGTVKTHTTRGIAALRDRLGVSITGDELEVGHA
jgi:RNA polymerase sigma-70 factor (sigma-E family)